MIHRCKSDTNKPTETTARMCRSQNIDLFPLFQLFIALKQFTYCYRNDYSNLLNHLLKNESWIF